MQGTSPARLWLQVFAAGFAVVCVLLLWTFLTPINYGDLTRTGRVSERAFGWRHVEPTVAPELLKAAPMDQADILVIGDSFSMTHRWQSVLTGAGYALRTAFWRDYDESLCADFDQWVAQAGFRGRLIVIESVERLMPERMRKLGACASANKPMTTQDIPIYVPWQQPPPFQFNTGAKVLAGLITWHNTWRIERAAGDVTLPNEVMGRVVPDGCSFFTSRVCGKSLFVEQDISYGEIPPAAVQQLRAFAHAHATVPILWMVIPNKTTVYLEPDHSGAFFDAFNAAGLGPDLRGFAFEQRHKLKDFYFTNDTHMSMAAQLVLGERMLQAVREVLPQPAARLP